MTEQTQQQTLAELTGEEFKEKYTAFVESRSGDSETKENYLFYGLKLQNIVADILKPEGFAGKKVTLLDSSWGDNPRFSIPLESVLSVAGSEVLLCSRGNNEAEYIKDCFTRNIKLDGERRVKIDQSDYLFCRASAVCNVVFFPIFYPYVARGKKTLLFLDKYKLEGQCRDDPELASLRELKSQGKDVHIITGDYYGLRRFL